MRGVRPPARRSLCASRGGVGGGGRARPDRPAGTASCAPSRISRSRLAAREKKGGFEGRAGARRLLAGRRPVPLRSGRPRRPPGRCPLGSRARSSPLLPALPGSPRPRARPAGSLRKRPGLRFAVNARVRAAGRPPGTMRPCGRRRGRAHSGDLTVPRGELGARRQRLPGACSLGDPARRAGARASVCPASIGGVGGVPCPGHLVGSEDCDSRSEGAGRSGGQATPSRRRQEGVPSRSPGAVLGKR
ncbi:translation initiation factor IF-2-like [Mustela erminea]|uniref:translation initiation factor IF-2-like n=1 Tax=Mustela erminea TaxID=36723 RepID=UPI001386801B|nr:translation initiation factor IF-2-like [Mustela erminea]